MDKYTRLALTVLLAMAIIILVGFTIAAIISG